MFVQVLQEAEEDGVHGHAVHREEGGGDGVRAQDDYSHWDKVVVQVNVWKIKDKASWINWGFK